MWEWKGIGGGLGWNMDVGVWSESRGGRVCELVRQPGSVSWRMRCMEDVLGRELRRRWRGMGDVGKGIRNRGRK